MHRLSISLLTFQQTVNLSIVMLKDFVSTFKFRTSFIKSDLYTFHITSEMSIANYISHFDVANEDYQQIASTLKKFTVVQITFFFCCHSFLASLARVCPHKVESTFAHFGTIFGVSFFDAAYLPYFANVKDFIFAFACLLFCYLFFKNAPNDAAKSECEKTGGGKYRKEKADELMNARWCIIMAICLCLRKSACRLCGLAK